MNLLPAGGKTSEVVDPTLESALRLSTAAALARMGSKARRAADRILKGDEGDGCFEFAPNLFS